MPNRSMQVKFERAARERAAIAIDLAQRAAYHDTIVEGEPSLAELVAAYDGKVKVCPAGKYNGYQSRVSRVGSGSKAPARTVSARTIATAQALRRASAIARNTSR